MQERFQKFADAVTLWSGSLPVVVAAFALVIGWAVTGPLFNFSQEWQLFINSTTTVITYLMVFVIQNSANRDSKAIHLKLNELLRAVNKAENRYIGVEQEDEDTLKEREQELLEHKE